MNRRSFLKRTAMFTAALSTLPLLAASGPTRRSGMRLATRDEVLQYGQSPITATEVLESQRAWNVEMQGMLDELIRPMTERCERIMEGMTV